MQDWELLDIINLMVVLCSIGAVFVATTAAHLWPLLQKKRADNSVPRAYGKAAGVRRKGSPPVIKIILSLLSLSIMLCLAYGFFVEPYKLVIHNVEIRTSKLNHSRIRLVQLSDLHSDESIRLETRLTECIPSLHPDVIVFTGDAVNSPAGLNNYRSLLKSLAGVAPVYVAKGDWDFSFNPPLEYFKGTGTHELFATPVRIEKDGESIWLAGVPVNSLSLVKETLGKIPAGAFTTFAYHEPYPDVLPLDASVDLLLCGHTHGGQVVLPGIGALITRSKYGGQYVSGMYPIGDMQMYVNRGVGMEGHLPRVRFLCPPEVAVFDIVPAS
jgi:uncharacterized protein